MRQCGGRRRRTGSDQHALAEHDAHRLAVLVLLTVLALGVIDCRQPCHRLSRSRAKATLRWLATDGAPLLRFHRTAVEWRPGRTRAECKRIGDQLDRIGTPEQIMLTIAGVEDEPLQSMLNAEVRSLAEAVTNCANGSSTTPAAGLLPLAELTALVEQRLRALRAVR